MVGYAIWAFKRPQYVYETDESSFQAFHWKVCRRLFR